jgi:hypothetical protein
VPQSWTFTAGAPDGPEAVRAGGRRGLHLALEQILTTARSRAPIEEHTLEQSGATAISGDGLHGTVSFDTPYAVRQHEDMTARHDEGRRAKYLESAMHDDRATAVRLVQQQLRRALGT